ncbi:peptidoglycan DD-metalloendopeptidase family protein [Lactobacillus johnsonii]|uniref:Peptidoglycan DD-metalloendopeptidase family protein n=1 Tax=Lactobacillus johnsonii TaxID=33959 RepID=A0A9X5AMQ6_LACJH|nr:peptidoglycan DD-metalloendopeptidase family protein [Lactobacillus johnsonii]MTE04119.1 peptidoglycan DD-metalloendopeptidase family protein [Lactobacillus johnsonii]
MNYIQKYLKKKIIKIICILSVIFGGAFIIVQSIQTLTSFLTIFIATQQASDCGDSGDGGPLTLDSTSGSGDSKVRAVAKAIANSLGIDAAAIYAQIALESADGNSYLAKTDNNFGGIKYSPALSHYATPGTAPTDGSGGIYAHFKSLDDFAAVYRNTVRNMLDGQKPANWREYVHIMKSKGYFTASEESYYNTGVGYYNAYNKVSSPHAGTDKVAYILPKQSNSSQKFTIKAAKLADKNVKTIKMPVVKPGILDEPGILNNAPINSQNLVPMRHMSKRQHETMGSKSAVNDAAGKAIELWGANINKGVAHAIDNTSKRVNKVTGQHILNTEGTKKTVQKADANQKEVAHEQKKAHDKAKKEMKNVEKNGDFANSDIQCSDGDDDGSVSGKWSWPFKGVTWDPGKSYEDGQQFGHTGYSRGGGNFHDGFDFGSAKYHGNVIAVHDGKVKFVGSKYGFWIVWVVSSDGYNEVYQEAFGGRGDISVKEGDSVKVGQKIGRLTQSHLHLGISKKRLSDPCEHGYTNDGTWLDPIKVIKSGLHSSTSKLSGSEDAARLWIIQHESSGNYQAVNGRYYGAYQLDKSYLTGKKYGGDGSLSESNQDYVAEQYMKSRYHTWQGAKSHWEQNNWW